MKITVSSGSCRILFEDADKFAGKEIHIKGERITMAFSNIARNSAGVLLIHSIVMTFLYKYIAKLVAQNYIRIIVLFAATLAISYALSYLIGKLGKAGKAITLND